MRNMPSFRRRLVLCRDELATRLAYAPELSATEARKREIRAWFLDHELDRAFRRV